MQISYLLFDLDETLLPMNLDEFLRAYMKALSIRMTDYMAPQTFIKNLLASTQVMINNDGSRTNEEVFMQDFFNRTQLPKDEVMPIFDDFYRRDFPKLKDLTTPNALSKHILEEAGGRGFELVIATNAVFPEIAINERLRWAGIENIPYRLVTYYEHMHFCKPNIGYYQEILDKIGAQPEECLMIGNDPDEDLIAGKLGIETFWVTDDVDSVTRHVEAAHQGNLDHLYSFIKRL
ncbi:MAG: HAD family hydrolase [Peptococcaceae bacterium]|nr:HAD family hydrolase [Peptococcaceae bacterium]